MVNYNTNVHNISITLWAKWKRINNFMIVNHMKSCLSPIEPINLKGNTLFTTAVFTYTVYREIFAPVLLSPLSPSLSAGELKIGRIPMFQVISFYT